MELLEVLHAIAVCIYPAVAQAEGEQLQPVWEGAARQAAHVVDNVLYGSPRQQLRMLLRLLSHAPTTLLLAGRQALCSSWPYVRAFPALPLQQQQQMLLDWQCSALPPLRKAYMALKSVVASSLVHTLESSTGTNRVLQSIKYSTGEAAARRYELPAAAGAAAAEEVLASGVVSLPSLLAAAPSIAGLKELLVKRGLLVLSVAEDQPGWMQLLLAQAAAWAQHALIAAADTLISWLAGREPVADKQALSAGGKGSATAGDKAGAANGCHLSASKSSHWSPQEYGKPRQWQVELAADVVVVGSGAGGGVAAALLAAAGLRVVVLEKSSWKRMSDMTWQEGEAMSTMYDGSGLLPSQNGAVNVLAGSTLGGGTKVNWCASLAAPQHVREEWAQQHGLPAFTSGAFQQAVDAVCKRLSVNDDTVPNGPNTLLQEGLAAVGADACRYPRNCTSKECCGYCTFGCRSGHKQSSDVTWLVDAVKAGAMVLTGVTAEQVLKERAPKGRAQPFAATGIIATASSSGPGACAGSQPSGGTTSLRITIRAPRVFSCGGSLHTPALLLRSGVTCQGNVGRNLRLHPACGVLSSFPGGVQGGTRDVECYKGVMMQTYCLGAAHYAQGGYGAMISVPAAHPALLAALCPWHTPTMMRELLAQLPTTFAAAVVFTRDSGGGLVQVDGAGRMVYDYWPCAATRQHLLEGLELAARAHAAAGASRLLVPHSSCRDLAITLPPPSAPEQRAAAVEAFVAALWRAGVEPWGLPLFSAHQMGSCRMGSDPRSSAIDPTGQCWEVSGLWVADASTFPTATGVNPMITAEAIAYMVAQGVAAAAKGM